MTTYIELEEWSTIVMEVLNSIASPRGSVSQGAAQKTSARKTKKARFLSPRFFLFFARRFSALRPD